ncbi:MAG TPA: hypothetical protein VI299_15900, partial [Polyangiales bacterium]
MWTRLFGFLLACALAACEDPAPAHEDQTTEPESAAPQIDSGRPTAPVPNTAAPGPQQLDTKPVPVAQCHRELTAHALDPLCASCACGRCAREVETCEGDCLEAATCMLQNQCEGPACYCGSGLFGCAFEITGPCKDSFEKAVGKRGEAAIRAALGEASSALGKAQALASCGRSVRCQVACAPAETSCGFNDLSCQQRYCAHDAAREAERAASASHSETPHIAHVLVNGQLAWSDDRTDTAKISAGDTVVLEGTGFGKGPDIDFSKLLVGNVRVLETDLVMYEQQLDISRQVHSETTKLRGQWPKDILSWSDTRIEFKVPGHVVRGPIEVQVQKRLGANESYVYPGQPHQVIDTQTLRIVDPSFSHACDVVSTLSDAAGSNEVPVTVDNPGLGTLVQKGREIFWSYDYNIGLTHSLRG